MNKAVLDSRADKILRRLRGLVVVGPADPPPKQCAILIGESVGPYFVHRSNIQPALHAAGMHLDGFDEVLEEVAKHSMDDGQHYPVFILIDGWLQVAYVECPKEGA